MVAQALREYHSILDGVQLGLVGIVLYAVVGYLDLGYAICIILLVGVISNTGIYLSIQTMASYLRGLEDGPEKEEAHELMIKIIKRRMLYLG